MPGSERPYEHINCIIDKKLYLGNKYAAASLETLDGLGVTHIVNAAEEQPNFFRNAFVYYNCHLHDNLVEKVDIDGPLGFIEEAFANGGVVFVHCLAGVSRSATMVIAYVMKNYEMSMTEAILKVLELRPVINPNPNFLRQLVQYEARLNRHQVRMIEVCN